MEALVALKSWPLRKHFVTLHFLKYPDGYNFSSNFILVLRVQNTSMSLEFEAKANTLDFSSARKNLGEF